MKPSMFNADGSMTAVYKKEAHDRAVQNYNALLQASSDGEFVAPEDIERAANRSIETRRWTYPEEYRGMIWVGSAPATKAA